MKDKILILILGFLLGAIFFMFLDEYVFIDNYRKGQIDVLNGIIKYELVEHPDKTKSWELKK